MESSVNYLCNLLRSNLPFDVSGNCSIHSNFLGIIYSGKRDLSSCLMFVVIAKLSSTGSCGTTAPMRCTTLPFYKLVQQLLLLHIEIDAIVFQFFKFHTITIKLDLEINTSLDKPLSVFLFSFIACMICSCTIFKIEYS